VSLAMELCSLAGWLATLGPPCCRDVDMEGGAEVNMVAG
jgi:hypothetical protein